MLSRFFIRIIWVFCVIFLIAMTQIAQAEFYENSYALVIGINKYPSTKWQNLKYAIGDAQGMAKFLEDQKFKVFTLYDQQATKTAIIAKMEDFLAPRVKKNDRILFFFAGHGHTEFLGGQDWGYIVPYDGGDSRATYISMEEIRTLSDKMGTAKHQLYIMDACYGGLLGTKAGGVDPNIPNYLGEITRRKAKQIITAGGKDQTVLDGGPYGHSVFTGNLLEALMEGFADINGDGWITFAEMVAYLVPKASNAYQTPAPGLLPGHGLGEFVFRSPKGVKKVIAEKPAPADTIPRSVKEAYTSVSPVISKEEYTNSIGMKFMLIQAGSFTMGSQISPNEVAGRYGNEAKYYQDEHPRHPVEITEPFYLQTTEVSLIQWKKVMGAFYPLKISDLGVDCPAEGVSWNDTQEFISKLNQMENTNKYRLPTEAEWEYACRAGTITEFSFGNEVDKLREYAWYSGNSQKKAHPVGQKKPNVWGLFDMHGNVMEWCQDWYGDYSYDSLTNPKGPATGTERVLRDASWQSNGGFLRSASRTRSIPNLSRAKGFGFRVARDF
jgi:formylglycine-generating enzyme required for sulfatase activity